MPWRPRARGARVRASFPAFSSEAVVRKQEQHEFLYWAFYERGGSRALRSGDWKAVQQPIHTPVRLYNLKKDLGEQRDVAADNVELVTKFTAAMDGAYAPSNRWKFP